MVAATARPLLPALEWVATRMKAYDGPWWIIGSAALCLHGISGLVAQDIDVLLPAAAAARIADIAGAEPMMLTPDELFRSDAFVRYVCDGSVIEFMAGLQVAGPEGWRTVIPESAIPISMRTGTLYVPDLADMVVMLQSFGRPKDQVRLNMIREQRPQCFKLS